MAYLSNYKIFTAVLKGKSFACEAYLERLLLREVEHTQCGIKINLKKPITLKLVITPPLL